MRVEEPYEFSVIFLPGITKMTLIVKTLKIDEDFDEKREIWFSPGSSDIPRGKLTKKNQNLKKKNFFNLFHPQSPGNLPP